MTAPRKALLALADGTVLEGRGFGAEAEAVGEVVFNTAMTGYQEVMTDPSYVGQLLTFTVPELGNVGANPSDEESDRPHAVGVVCRHLSLAPSNYRATEGFDGWLARHGVPGIEGVDTRKLVRHLRDGGVQLGVLSTVQGARPADLVEKARKAPPMTGLDLATPISTKKAYDFTTGMADPLRAPPTPPTRHRVVAYDYGLKKAMLQLLVDQGMKVTVVPAATPAAEVLAMKPDGVFLTNGPGDPAAVKAAGPIVRELLGKTPIFGICLGHQILALALGARTYKLKFGHRGGNQPVLDLATGQVAITAQNHGFAVDEASLAGTGARVTHRSLNDGTNEGIEVPDARAFSVQYHPESSPGPHDARNLFHRFARLIEGRG